MKVLTFTSLFPNARKPELGIFIYHRVAHFATRSCNEVKVVVPVPYVPFWLPLKRWSEKAAIPSQDCIGILNAHYPRYPLAPGIMPLHAALMRLGSLQLVRRLHEIHHFDCIDAHYIYPDATAAVLIGRRLGVPVFVSARGTDINIFPSFRLIRPMIRWTLEKSAGIIAVSQALKEKIVNLGIAAPRVRVIGNGVDTRLFHPIEHRAARQHLRLPEYAKIAVAVGSLVSAKGYERLIPAFAAFVKHVSDAYLYVVGEGELRGKLEQLTRSVGAGEHICFVGARPYAELKWWFSAADVSCLTSIREGWPNVILESLACGTPVVATRVCGIPEILVSPELGVLVDERPEGIGQGLEVAFRRAWNRAALVDYARRRTWDVVAAEMEEYFVSHLAAYRDVTSSNGDN